MEAKRCAIEYGDWSCGRAWSFEVPKEAFPLYDRQFKIDNGLDELRPLVKREAERSYDDFL
ncbi:uncharacterized protein G2W53_035076 [Senna tora]|uniref:Uncharacterized protein n=1 Tax=Senna tora TaxID=362788 RepID=A0A834SS82_9FABA|nr:uncharacterized protein G2W53_035076 [Senna tora]